MSLNAAERSRTSSELRENLRLSGLTADEVVADLGWSRAELDAALAVEAAHPAAVWLLRDYLEQANRDAGVEPTPFTVLTAASRSSAEAWFDLSPAPRHDFGR